MKKDADYICWSAGLMCWLGLELLQEEKVQILSASLMRLISTGLLEEKIQILSASLMRLV